MGNWLRNIFKTFSVAIFIGLVAVVGILAAFFFSLLRGLPDVATLKEYKHEIATEVYSDDGKRIGEFLTERRYPVRFESIPQHVLRAFLAAEDAKFYEHGGIDYTGIARAVLSNVLTARYAQGGSTITQQVARSLLLSSRKKEITRKIREMILALRMEKELTKNEILSLYLSEIYLGHGAYGIGAAAQNYFNKKVEDLSIAEGAMLAGLPQRPNDWDPFHNPHIAKKRQLYVLRRMVDEKFLTAEVAKEAAGETLKLYPLEDLNNEAAPYFTEYVRQYLMNKYGSENVLRQGFKVYTTVRYDFQKEAERSVDKGLRAVDKRLGWRGILKHLDNAQTVESFAEAIHEQVLEEVSKIRLLVGNSAATTTRKLAYDMSAFEGPASPYFGPTPVKEGEYHEAVVTRVFPQRQLMTGRIGRTNFQMPFALMNWVKIKDVPAKSVSQVVREGDVIEVKVEKIDRQSGVVTASLEQEPEIQGALLSYDLQNGFVRAMVGGRDFVQSKFNRALHAKRQVGSTAKPILYAAAMDKGFSPSSLVTDSPIVFKFDGALDADSQGEEWRPKNYNGKFVGDIPLRLALVRSMNIPTVKLLNEIGVDYEIQYARNLGITAALPRDLSIALGSWSTSLEELTRAYAVFPRLGKPLVLLNYIKKVVDGDGKVLEELPREASAPSVLPVSAPATQNPNSGAVISPQTAYVITDMLRGVVREGTGIVASVVPAAVAGKTGTSNDHRDAWFVGYTPQTMTGMWLGYDNNKPLDPAETGGRAAGPIWVDYMQKVVATYPRTEFPIPDDIVFAYVDRSTGKPAGPSAAKRVRVAFKIGTVPNADGSNVRRIGEPGTRAMTQEAGAPPAAIISDTAEKVETSDLLREDY